MQKVTKVLSTCGYNLREVRIDAKNKWVSYYFKIKGFEFSIEVEVNLNGRKEELSVRTTRNSAPRKEIAEILDENVDKVWAELISSNTALYNMFYSTALAEQ